LINELLEPFVLPASACSVSALTAQRTAGERAEQSVPSLELGSSRQNQCTRLAKSAGKGALCCRRSLRSPTAGAGNPHALPLLLHPPRTTETSWQWGEPRGSSPFLGTAQDAGERSVSTVLQHARLRCWTRRDGAPVRAAGFRNSTFSDQSCWLSRDEHSQLSAQ